MSETVEKTTANRHKDTSMNARLWTGNDQNDYVEDQGQLKNYVTAAECITHRKAENQKMMA